MLRFEFLSLSVLLLTASVEAVEAQSQPSVEKAMSGYAGALCTGNAHRVASWYTADGHLLLPGLAPLKGRAAIEAFLAPMTASSTVQSVRTQSETIALHGRTADQWGTYQEVAGPRGKALKTYSGRYAALWRREGGQWHLFRLMMQPL